jgi:hypothetical protein
MTAPDTPDEELPVDIHKPKPWHGFREFLKEYLIIVVGVLTALGGEQVVENLHWRHVLSEEREALNAEVAVLRGAVLSRAELQDCVDARLDAVAKLIRRHDQGGSLATLGPIGRPIYYSPTPGTWDLAVADQSLSRMPFTERQKYLFVYERFGAYTRNVTDERTAWRNLQVLNEAKSLSPADWSTVRQAYEQAVEINTVIRGTDHWLEPYAPFPVHAKPGSVTGSPMVKAFCTPFISP